MEYLTLDVDCGIIRVRISYGSILFDSIPPRADIYLIASGGGPPVYTMLQTPNTISSLPVGNYDYILKLSGYEDYTGTTTVNANETTTIIANLVQIPTSPVTIAASGAAVLGLLLMTTSRVIIPLTTGKLGGNIVAVKL